MTLVPIIYTSLLIFTSLLLFVIIISYISFKLKPQKQVAPQDLGNVRNLNINRVHNYHKNESYFMKSYEPKSLVKENVYQPNKIEHNNFNETLIRNTKRLEIMNTNDHLVKINNVNNQLKIQELPYSRSKNFRITDENILDFYADSSVNNYSSFSSI